MIVRLAIRYLYRSLPNQPGSYLNWKLLAKDHPTPKLLRSPLRVVRHIGVKGKVYLATLNVENEKDPLK